MSLVWTVRLPDSEKIVLLALADAANDEGLCWPSMATLSTKCSKSDRTVQAAIKSLVASGHLSRQELPGRGCRYIVHPTPEAASPPKPLPPEDFAPPKRTTVTPEAASDNPSRTITSPKASPSSRASTRQPKPKPQRLSDDWNPVRFSDGTVAREIVDRRGGAWARAAMEKFRNWAANADDRNGRKLDWQRAWANWVIEEDNRNGAGAGRGTGSKHGAGSTGMGPAVDAGQRFLQRRGLGGAD